jgi:hypothetical protein
MIDPRTKMNFATPEGQAFLQDRLIEDPITKKRGLDLSDFTPLTKEQGEVVANFISTNSRDLASVKINIFDDAWALENIINVLADWRWPNHTLLDLGDSHMNRYSYKFLADSLDKSRRLHIRATGKKRVQDEYYAAMVEGNTNKQDELRPYIIAYENIEDKAQEHWDTAPDEAKNNILSLDAAIKTAADERTAEAAKKERLRLAEEARLQAEEKKQAKSKKIKRRINNVLAKVATYVGISAALIAGYYGYQNEKKRSAKKHEEFLINYYKQDSLDDIERAKLKKEFQEARAKKKAEENLLKAKEKAKANKARIKKAEPKPVPADIQRKKYEPIRSSGRNLKTLKKAFQQSQSDVTRVADNGKDHLLVEQPGVQALMEVNGQTATLKSFTTVQKLPGLQNQHRKV